MISKITRFSRLTLNSLKSKGLPMVYYDGNSNWGDALNEYIFEKVSGESVKRVNPYIGMHYLGIGSIVSALNHNSIIVGSGAIEPDVTIKGKPSRIVSVRGEKTRKILLDHGIECPEIYGDVALAMPCIYKTTVAKKYKIGFIPHFKDVNLKSSVEFMKNDDVHFIDIMQGIESFIDEINSCELIVSSSLHGLIASDAYQIKNVWVQLSDNVIGGSFKFEDYYTSLKKYNETPVTSLNVELLIKIASVKATDEICKNVYEIIKNEFK